MKKSCFGAMRVYQSDEYGEIHTVQEVFETMIEAESFIDQYYTGNKDFYVKELEED